MFSDADRAIFGPFFNGQGMVYADPLRVYRELSLELDGDPQLWIARSRDDDPRTRLVAEGRLVQASRSAFGLAPFEPDSGQGAQDQDALTALRSYLVWLDQKKSSGLTSPTSPVPTGPVYSDPYSLMSSG
jgi:hypothetical protein